MSNSLPLSTMRNSLTRRRALRNLAAFLAGSPLLDAQRDPWRDHSRVPGLDEMISSFDFEAVAFEKLPRAAYNYTAHGAAGEFTVRRNREAFDWVKLIPRAVAQVSSIDASSEVLGTPMRFPILLAPSAAHKALHPLGEQATYAGAGAASGTPMIVSHVTSTPFSEIAQNEGGPLWYQLYPQREIAANREPLSTAQEAGCKAVVVTIDQQAPYFERTVHDRHLSARRGRPPRRPADKPNPYRLTSRRLWYEWKLIEQLRPFVEVPLLVKGVLTAADARRSIDHGLDGIIVSNHGGRALDYSPSTLEVLPEIVDAVGGRIPLLIDGGFRRGSDILKALALGASAVCLGRVPRWGLAAYGAVGVQRVLEILQAELIGAMAHTGCADLAAVHSSIVGTDWP